MKKRTFLWLGCAILSVALTLWAAWALQLYRHYQQIPSEPNVGNRASNLKALKETGFPFSFLVIGDIHNSLRGQALLRSALKEGTPSFLVLLGDSVISPDVWNHRLFLTEMAVETKLPFPVFIIPGNHDIDHTPPGQKKEREGVTREMYEALYGGGNFDFTFNQCLFVLCGVDFNRPEAYLTHLQEALSKKGQGKKHIFVFVHFPPEGLAPYIEGPLPLSEKFLSLVETYKVTACFFGDFHGHWRGQRNGVNLIVAGGGGRLKATQPEWGKFHHILRVTVDKDTVSESLIVSQKEFPVGDNLRHWTFSLLFPIIDNHGWILYGLLLIFLFLSLLASILFILSLRRRKGLKLGYKK